MSFPSGAVTVMLDRLPDTSILPLSPAGQTWSLPPWAVGDDGLSAEAATPAAPPNRTPRSLPQS